MGAVFADITLKNSGDLTRLKDGSIAEQNVRSLTVNALVDTGAPTLIINDEVCRRLGLDIEDSITVSLAGGGEASCKVTEPVRICWKNRFSTCQAWVLPGESGVLLGAIPLEDMDLVVNPAARALVGAHGDKIVGMVK